MKEKEKKEKEENKYIAQFFSKISKIYIEIHNFNFRHGVFEGNDNNFIGRDEIRNRIKAIFSQSDSNSGTYLITGQRGVGKTSLINKVIAELSGQGDRIFWKHMIQYLILFAIIVLLTFIDKYIRFTNKENIDTYNCFLTLASLISFIFCMYYITFHSLQREVRNFRFKKKKPTISVICWLYANIQCFLMEFFVLYKEKTFETKLMKCIKYVAVISFIILLGCFKEYNYIYLFLLYGIIVLLIFICADLNATFVGNKHNDDEYLCKTYRSLIKKNTSNKVFQKIRLYVYPVIYTLCFCIFIGVYIYLFSIYPCGAAISLVLIIFFSPFFITKIIQRISKKESLRNITLKILFKKARKHRSLKKFFDRTKYICIKINLGYDNLHNLDVLKLVAHNVDREYKKFLNTGYVYWVRQILLITSCFFLSYMVYQMVEQPGTSLFFSSKKGIPSELSNLHAEITKLQKITIEAPQGISNNIAENLERMAIATDSNNVDDKRNRINIIRDASDKIIKQISYVQNPDTVLYLNMKMEDIRQQMNYAKTLTRAFEIRDDIKHKIKSPLLKYKKIFKTKKTNKEIAKDTIKAIAKKEDEKSMLSQIFRMLFTPTFLLTFLLFFFVLRYFFIHKQKRILKQLKELEDSIAADIKKEEISEKGLSRNKMPLVFTYKNKKEKAYPRSDVHDIEKQLIEILKEISTIHYFVHPQFIVVFDELDKIEPDESDSLENLKTNSFLPQNTRNRQQAIFSLLSGLKYFLTTAQAKFVFVAGKEIYEASLADVADRSYYVGSIFHDVINVPSFMSDFSDNKISDICSMTEQYVCRHLFPTDYIVEEYTLAKYDEYLKDKDDIARTYIVNEKQEEYKAEQEIIRRKIITLLDNFILYLTHVGKGAPKKMISLFEQFVERYMPYNFIQKIEEDEHIIKKTRSNTIYYLVFDFYAQYRINFISYLVYPIILRFNTTNQQKHGDKMLVSSLFLLDHLYKFHRHAFSWRALESSPELIDISKTPELRIRIKDQLHYLSQNHIKQVDNGLYHFRFYKKIAHEIAFLTRVSEEASAIYNFTLDESYNVKQYYHKLLKDMQNLYKEEMINPQHTITSFSSLHFTLGELYLYDEEVEEAIMEFNSAISVLSANKPMQMTPEQIIILIKAMLCLGIAYEKKNINDQAFLVYSEIVKLLISSRDINIQKFGLQTEQIDGQMRVLFNPDKENPSDEPGIFFKDIETWEHLTCLLDGVNHLHPEIQNTLNHITSYEGLRIFYLPLLAKLQILEKSQVGGIRLMDVKRLIKEFVFLTNMVNKDNYSIMFADFYTRLGDILYYKNSKFIKDINTFSKFFPYDFNIIKNNPLKPPQYNNDGVEQLQKRMKCIHRCGICKHISESPTPCDACYFYKYSILLLLEKKTGDISSNHIENWMKEIIGKLLTLKEDDDFKGWDETRFNLLARILSNLGDCMLSCKKDIENEEYESLRDFLFHYITIPKDKNDKETEKKRISAELNKIKEASKEIEWKEKRIIQVTALYLLSALYYKKATSYNMTGQQYSRILSILKDMTKNLSVKGIKIDYSDKIETINKHFSYHAIKCISNSYKNVHFVEIKQLENLFDKSKNKNYRNLLMSNDTFEIILLYTEIKYRCFRNSKTQFDSLYSQPEIDAMFKGMAYALNSSIYNRIMFLSFKSKINKEEFYRLWMESDMNISDLTERIEYFITDSIFNLTEIIRFSNIYGETYLLTNIFIAETHKELMYWCKLKESYEKLIEGLNQECIIKTCPLLMLREITDIIKRWHPLKKQTTSSEMEEMIQKMNNLQQTLKLEYCNENLKKVLGKAIGEEACLRLSVDFERANALRAYYKAREMHTEGRTYKNMIERGCYLNDEYNDRKFHFLTAVECYKINTNFDIYRQGLNINNLNYTQPKMYDPEMYLSLTD